ncbi:LysR family transcriptional regulator [Sphingorhabdus arenilitoris]|uniref:LysR family transcriptional regulator n=1 Tax=Sphingorhabdus arenilitoris TaxID=1490041 RepID=A0ABV8RIL4_9SPHN
MKTFLAAAETGSFAGAAQSVNASPSSVTERIKQLEHRLGVTLFDRDRRGCRLTSAGTKFRDAARQTVRAWELGLHNVSLPDEFTRSLSFGGQYALWRAYLLPWLADARRHFSDIAFNVTAGASPRLNRDLAEGKLDIAVMYNPVFRRDVVSELLFNDPLILVGPKEDSNWRGRYVHIDWGPTLSPEIAINHKLRPMTGLNIDLGVLSKEWLIHNEMYGFMPSSLVRKDIANGNLYQITEIAEIENAAYVCWRRELDSILASDIITHLKTQIRS